MIPSASHPVLGKVAVPVARALARRRLEGGAGVPAARTLAGGDGWVVEDVICTSGPEDRPFEELHGDVSIAVVIAGSFQYRSPAGRALMMPGSVLLGSAGQCFECGHQHGAGDRCVAFRYSAERFAALAAEAEAPIGPRGFAAPRLPPLPELAGLVTRAGVGAVAEGEVAWEEVAVELAGRVARLATGRGFPAPPIDDRAVGRVTAVVRSIEDRPTASLELADLAQAAGLSRFHFLRVFQRVTGVTPHQYLIRTRLRAAALRLALEPDRVAAIAFEAGFGDLSNFNRAFRREYGVAPLDYRRAARFMRRVP